FFLVIILMKSAAGVLHSARLSGQSWQAWVAAAFWGFFVLSTSQLAYSLYIRRSLSKAAVTQKWFLWLNLVPAILAGACATWLANDPPAGHGLTPAEPFISLLPLAVSEPLLAMTVFGVAAYLLSVVPFRVFVGFLQTRHRPQAET